MRELTHLTRNGKLPVPVGRELNMSRSFRSPRTATQVHRDRRNEILGKIEAQEAQEQLKECKNCVMVTTGYECPKCGEISAPNYSLEAVRTEEALYGTAYGAGRMNDGLGEKTYGKKDFKRRVDRAGLRQREPGEAMDRSRDRQRNAAESRKQIHHEISESMRHFDL